MQAHLSKSSPLSKYDRIRIVGQGLAGSLLAIHLKEQNIPFIVQDIDTPGCATAVAPGIVNPLAGRHFRPPEYIDELLEQLDRSMQLVEKTLGVNVWNPCPILRMFSEPAQHDRFISSIEGKGSAAFVDEEFGENTFSCLNDVYGSFLTKRGGWANLPFLMEITRSWLRQEGLMLEQDRFLSLFAVLCEQVRSGGFL